VEETFTHLSLNIGEPEGGGGGEELRAATPLSQLLARWFDAEVVERRCEHCLHTKACVSKALSSLPRTLVLHLNRYNNHAPAAAPLAAAAAAAGATPPPKAAAQPRKERARVEFTQSLCVDQFGVAAHTPYQLHSMLSHWGKHATSGHYIADVRDPLQHCWVRLTPY
jgi:uncharacterized UBP type Zn finger protein